MFSLIFPWPILWKFYQFYLFFSKNQILILNFICCLFHWYLLLSLFNFFLLICFSLPTFLKWKLRSLILNIFLSNFSIYTVNFPLSAALTVSYKILKHLKLRHKLHQMKHLFKASPSPQHLATSDLIFLTIVLYGFRERHINRILWYFTLFWLLACSKMPWRSRMFCSRVSSIPLCRCVYCNWFICLPGVGQVGYFQCGEIMSKATIHNCICFHFSWIN